MNYMKNDVRIVKEMPPHLQSLDLEAIGSQVGESQPYSETSDTYLFNPQKYQYISHQTHFAQTSVLPSFQVTDMDISKEAEPSELVKSVLPILQQNGVVHFLGFGNRLGFDSVPVHLQVTTCLSLFLMIISTLCFVVTTNVCCRG